MPVKPLKDPRYKPIPGRLRRYQDVQTGEVIGRKEFERRTNPAKAAAAPTGSTSAPIKMPGNQGPTPVPDRAGSASAGPVPMVETPEPPSFIQQSYDVTKEAAEVAHAAAAGMDLLATKIGQGVAQSASYFAQAFLPDRLAYWAPPEPALRQVTEPAARLIARHSHVQLDLGPDADDIGDLFVGVMACVTAISVQKIQYENAKMQAIHDFEVLNGPGSYAKALAASRGQAPGGAVQNGQAQNALSNENPAGHGANGHAAAQQHDFQRNGHGPTLTDELLAGYANGHRERRSL